jgi:peptide/nickel transport system permease protein
VTTVAVPKPRSPQERASGAPDFFRYLVRKLLALIVSFAVLLVIGYVIFSVIPSDPLESLIRQHKTAMSPAEIAALRHQLGLDQSPLQRFGEFVWHTLQGNLGYSWQFQAPVSSLILQRLWPTLLLTGSSMILAAVVGLWLGARSGWRPGSPLDRTSSAVSLTFWSVPTFWLGLILLVLFSGGFGAIPPLFPSGGMSTPGTAGGLAPSHILDVAWHLLLPCLTQALVIFARYVTIMRSSVLDERGSPYLLTARAKGLRDSEVRSKHAVPNALLPTVTVIFLQLGTLVTGAVTVESVFSWPGLGYLTYQALSIPDLPLLEGTFIVFSASVIVMNMLADIVYRFLDPRVRRQ